MSRLISALILGSVMLNVCVLWAWSAPTYAYYEAYSPLTPAQLQPAFKVKRLGEFEANAFPKQLQVGTHTITTKRLESESADDLVLMGEDKQHKPWSVQLGARFYTAYTSDLDANGQTDLILIFPTMGNGLAPSEHLISIMFDKQGRPKLAEIEGYLSYSAKGIGDLIDLNKDKQAELIYMNYADGYWITNLYQAKNASWKLIKGKFSHSTFPLYTRFTTKPNHKSVVPPANRHPTAPDLSNTEPVLTGTLVSYQWADIQSSEDAKFTLQTPTKKVDCKPVSWYSSFAIVVDTPEGRQIVSAAALDTRVKAVLDDIVKHQYPVTLYGQREDNVCSPELIWASSVN